MNEDMEAQVQFNRFFFSFLVKLRTERCLCVVAVFEQLCLLCALFFPLCGALHCCSDVVGSIGTMA